MKIFSRPRLLKLALCAITASAAAVPASAVTVSIQSTFGVNVIDSEGSTILDSMNYVFEFGTFAGSFVPTYANMSQWEDNWVIFTTLTYNEPLAPSVPGYQLAGSAEIIKDALPGDVVVPNEPLTNPGRDPLDVGGYSSWYRLPNGELDPSKPVAGSTFDFSGKKGYLWVYDSTDPYDARIQQFLGSSSDWIFPNKFVETADNCCDDRVDVLWSITQINEPPPVGDFPPGPPPETIQLIPEPNSVAIGLMGAFSLLFRRRRA